MQSQARHDNRPDRTGPRGPGPAGFTLIELLTVVAIIGLLVGMVVPTIQSVLDSLYAARTLTRIDNLANGAKMYKIEGTGNKYFPAQQYAKNILEGSGCTIGMAGSAASGQAVPTSYAQAGGAFLARCLFSKPDPNSTPTVPKPDQFPVSNWSVLDNDMLDPPDATNSSTGRDTPKPYSIEDCSSHPLAILYFVSRTNLIGKPQQFVTTDNNVYIIDNTYLATNTASNPMDIQWFCTVGNTDPTLSSAQVRMDGQFIIVAAGKASSTGSRKYFDTTTGLSNLSH